MAFEERPSVRALRGESTRDVVSLWRDRRKLLMVKLGGSTSSGRTLVKPGENFHMHLATASVPRVGSGITSGETPKVQRWLRELEANFILFAEHDMRGGEGHVVKVSYETVFEPRSAIPADPRWVLA